MSESPRPFIRSRVFWLLIAIFAVEFCFFDQVGARRHTGIYPRWDDQVQYLSESYIAYERSRSEGFAAALRYAVLHPSAQGTLHDLGALLAFKLAGPSRSAALALNMLALIAWQLALFIAIRRLSGADAPALLAALLPLALAGPWENIPGSAYDFRLDHFAMCALGVAASVAVLTQGFTDRRASVTFGVAVAATLLTRYLTGTFLFLIFLAFFGWTLTRPDRRVRVINLILAAVVATALAGPILWLSRERVIDYYWIGHFVGPESAVRAAHMNVPASVWFIIRHLGERHLGLFFGAIAVLGVIVFATLGASGRRAPMPGGLWLVGGLFLLAPAIIFTLHRQKSEVVLSVLAPGVVLLVIAGWLALRRSTAASTKMGALLPIGLALVILAFFIQRQVRSAYDAATLAHIRTVNTIADRLFASLTRAPFPEPNIAVDHINDALHAEVLRVIFYERHRVWLPIKMTLPTGVVEPAADDVVTRLQRSHIVIMTDDPAPTGRYPYDAKLAEMRPQLRAWCEASLRRIEQFTLFGRSMSLYQHPEIPFAAAHP